MHAAHERQARDRGAEGARGARPSWALGRCRPPPPPCPDTDSQARTHRRRPLPLCDCADAAPAPTHTHTRTTHDFVLFSRPTHRSSLTLRHHLISIRGNILIISSSPTHWRPHHLIIIHTLATGLITSHHSRPTSPTTRRPGGAHEAQRRPGGAHEAQRRPGGAHEAQRQPAPIPSTRGGRRHVAPRSPLARPLRAR